MSCQLDVATELKQDILDCNATARRQIGDFLLALQENPLPADRREMNDAAFYCLLPCGFYVSWEVFGDLVKFALSGTTKGIFIRILGVGRVPPE